MITPIRLPNGVPLRISLAEGVLGGKVWPAAHRFCQYLVDVKSSLPDDVKVLELGSGTGVVGMYAAALGMDVTLTEYRPPLAAAVSSVPYNVDGTLDYEWLESVDIGDDSSPAIEPPRSDVLLDLLKYNIQENRDLFPGKKPLIRELDWSNTEHTRNLLEESVADEERKMGQREEGYDLVIASDVTYISSMHEPLAASIAGLLKKRGNVSNEKVLSSYETWQQEPFLPKCLIAHQPRVLNIRGLDSQLLTFQDALEKQDLVLKEIRDEKPIDFLLGGDTLLPDEKELVLSNDIDRKEDNPVTILEIWHSNQLR